MPESRDVGYSPEAEWLEPDGLGGFASGTVGGARTRRYHALLLAATTPPTGCATSNTTGPPSTSRRSQTAS